MRNTCLCLGVLLALHLSQCTASTHSTLLCNTVHTTHSMRLWQASCSAGTVSLPHRGPKTAAVYIFILWQACSALLTLPLPWYPAPSQRSLVGASMYQPLQCLAAATPHTLPAMMGLVQQMQHRQQVMDGTRDLQVSIPLLLSPRLPHQQAATLLTTAKQLA